MNKYLKYFSGTLVGLMLSTSAFAAAEYAVVLKTLSNPFWVDMKKALKMKQKHWASALIFLPLLQKAIFNLNCSYLNLSNKNYKGIAFAPLSSVNLVMPVARAWKKAFIWLISMKKSTWII